MSSQLPTAPGGQSPEPERQSSQAIHAGIVRSAGVVSAAVFLSRITGLVREVVFAKYFGASMVYDAFVAAFRIPNLLRDLLAEGALSSAFVTTFSQYLGGGRGGGSLPAFESFGHGSCAACGRDLPRRLGLHARYRRLDVPRFRRGRG